MFLIPTLLLLTAPLHASFITDCLQPNDLVFDVGAHIGNKTDVYLSLGARVVCFEPQKPCVQYLHKKYAFNKNVTIVDKGLADTSGKLPLYTCQASVLTSFTKKWQTGRFAGFTWNEQPSDYIEVITLESAIQKYGRPTFCKIDVEGFEYNVLRGLHSPIKFLSFEFTKEFLDDAQKCIQHLRTLGYDYFNCAYGEETTFILDCWVPAETLITTLKQNPEPLLWGDIYAYCSTAI